MPKIETKCSAGSRQELLDRLSELDWPVVAPEPRDRVGDFGDGVVWLQHRAVPRRAPRRQAQPGDALLGRLHEVEPLAAEGHAEPADLADRLCHAFEQLRVLLDQPLRTE